MTANSGCGEDWITGRIFRNGAFLARYYIEIKQQLEKKERYLKRQREKNIGNQKTGSTYPPPYTKE